jgi:antitoxin VapB
MGLFIKNPEVERKARELAALRGASLTSAIDMALDDALKLERAKPRARPTLEQMRAATEEFRRATGLDKVKLNVTKADFDALWEIPGLDDVDPA